MSRRLAAALLALGLLGASCIAPDAEQGTAGGVTGDRASLKRLIRRACAEVPHDALLRTWRGTRLDRSGDIQIIPFEPDFVNGGLTHATPFDHTQEVPLLLFGSGIRPGVYPEPVTLADVAPTLGAVLDFPFETPDGHAQLQALLPEDRREPPRLVVTLVWDSAGDNVLERWPEAWPTLRAMAEEGAWFTDAQVGASPSNTPTGHATIGTGRFPNHNGFVDEYIRVNGMLQKPNENGPGFLLDPTLADLYDRAMGNEPKVAAIATLAAHVMMMGHGSQWVGGDRDIAVTRENESGPTAGAESTSWNLTSDMSSFYVLPAYANELAPLEDYLDEVDRADGARDGMWREHAFAQYAEGFDTPARTPYQQALVEEVMRREELGADRVPDLLFVNYKAIDTIGHLFSADGIEMSDAVRTQDDALASFVAFLDETVGRGRWTMAVVADHGTQDDPRVSGAFSIDIRKLEEGLAARFDDDGDDAVLVKKVRPTQIWLNHDELEDNGLKLADITGWLFRLSQAEVVKPGRTPPEPQAPVFAGVLPSRILSGLPCLPEASAG
ncbi:MAG TPA: alkaline phosphatase family protein [Actinomycetota bacterium]|nr:alkaline phosphatase family protein [Actinomycetota bacterium]